MNQPSQAKALLRAKMKAVRSAIPEGERARVDEAICNRLCDADQFRQADVVMPYLSFGAEVETRGIIARAWESGKRVALPRCTGPREMRWFFVDDLECLETSSLGVAEPALDIAREFAPDAEERMLAIVPGLAFDARGYRLGYGGGFYDTFLAGFAGTSIGLCRSAQMVSDLRSLGVLGRYDLPVDAIVTEDSNLSCCRLGETDTMT